MLVFLVPLQSPAASKDWRMVSRLAERTLRSVCRQTGDSFRVVLVCNRRPETDFTHPALTIIEEDFPVPTTREERMVDKSRKINRGAVFARSWAPFHLMLTDADDCVSNRLAGFVDDHPQAQGWYFQTGYLHDQGSPFVFRHQPFHLLCGTSHIIRCQPADLPARPGEPDDDYWLLSHGHPEMAEFLARRGTPLARLPFPGTLYNTATGENYSGIAVRGWRGRRDALRKLFNCRLLTAAVREEFGFYELT
jgi:hypothetical protein